MALREELATAVAALDNTAVSPALVDATRALFAPLHDREPYLGAVVERDLAYGADPRQRLDVFRPAARGDRRPVLVYVHGGGFVAGEKTTPNSPYYDNIPLWAAREGFVGVNVTYRLAPAHPFPAAPDDLARAVQWVRDNIAARGGDPNAIVLFGQSAGATHVASYLARTPNAPLAGAVLFSGVYDFVPMSEMPNVRAYAGFDPERLRERSPLAGVAMSDVPLMVGIAQYDPPPFHLQAGLLVAALQARHGFFPNLLFLPRHNHLSQVVHLGARDTGETQVADRLREFVALHARRALTPVR